MIHGGMATVLVSDMDRSVDFYTAVLGMTLLFRAGDHWASIDAGDGLAIGLHPASDRSPAPGTVGAISIGLSVTKPIEQCVEELSARGVHFHGPVLDEGILKLAFFSDPDGNALYLSEQPKWGSQA